LPLLNEKKLQALSSRFDIAAGLASILGNIVVNFRSE